MAYLQFLVIEDNSIIRKFIAKQLSEHGRVFEAESKEKASEMILSIKPDAAFIDLNLTDSETFEGLQLVDLCKEQGIPSIVLTAHQEKKIYQDAYERGAQHFFAKEDLDGESGLNHSILNFIKTLKDDGLQSFFKSEFITNDENLISNITFLREQVLNFDQKVLITGPTGVGKTKIAELIHRLTRPESPFISKNLTELSDNLFEAELFGYKKGSFTGAIQDKIGLLELADQGTLFLDEIGSLSFSMQQKLLKVIEEKKFTPIGTNEIRKSNFRLITATCEDLPQKIENKEFRADFYFRIKGTQIEIPPLKMRRSDIIPLLDHFISKSQKKISFSKKAEEVLTKYDWFGNIRELKSLVQEFMSYSKGYIQDQDLPSHILSNQNPLKTRKNNDSQSLALLNSHQKSIIKEKGLPELITLIEKKALSDAIEEHGNKINALCRHLQISKSVFYRISKELGEETNIDS